MALARLPPCALAPARGLLLALGFLLGARHPRWSRLLFHKLPLGPAPHGRRAFAPSPRAAAVYLKSQHCSPCARSTLAPRPVPPQGSGVPQVGRASCRERG